MNDWGLQPLSGYRRRTASPPAALGWPAPLQGSGFAPSSFDPATPPRHVLAHALTRSVGAPLMSGNRAVLLADDGGAALAAAIARARLDINLETAGLAPAADVAAAARLVELLCERRRVGVRVNLLLHGARDDGRIEALRSAGVAVADVSMSCGKPGSTWPGRALLLEAPAAERELALLDGRLALTGQPAADGWRAGWLQIEGPAVAQLQGLFLRRWQHHAGAALPRLRYFPPLAPAGSQRIGLAACDEHERRRNAFYDVLLAAVEAAHDSVLLATDGFVPTRRWLAALAAAARRGVEVRLLLASVSEGGGAGEPLGLPLAAGPSHWQRLQQAGVHLHVRPDGLACIKAAVIDGVWATLGTGRLDWRSFLQHNSDASVVVLDAGFAAELEHGLRADLEQAAEISAGYWA